MGPRSTEMRLQGVLQDGDVITIGTTELRFLLQP